MSEKTVMAETWNFSPWKPPPKFQKTVLNNGVGLNIPQEGAVCSVTLESQDTVLLPLVRGGSPETVELTVGEADTEIEQILDSCVRTMKAGEVCALRFCLDDDKIHRRTEIHQQCPVENTEESCNLDFPHAVNVKLEKFTEVPGIWQLQPEEKLQRASHHKDVGVKLFQKQETRAAFIRFSKAMKYIVSLEHDYSQQKQQFSSDTNFKNLKLLCHLNMAACQLKCKKFDLVVKNCTEALKIDPQCVKALYRRGSALLALQDYDQAKKDLEKAHELNPIDTAIVRQLKELKINVKKYDNKLAHGLKKLFS
ncbi:peptidyl-prolyl cis-trans isomerase FKBP62-like [Limulus polyphemus]|uniref:Peptidyl-prolyl cis-trans isomerase FKBP62-like n=1 Tax=Limulus polyphemus TaxID=6850 RepID=A0ABM1STW4_LIMPO|nr:peptidyl-prolyl cis-trans isomerase FKBP62-like [Limulus polyphemus]